MNQIEVDTSNIHHIVTFATTKSQIELSPLTTNEVLAPLMLEKPLTYPEVPTEQEVNAIAPP